ncbi:MAG: biotin--[acetyl-CoA-carboxylase] ligase [Clostridia bacterium]|nr:biotin--[acetyl-CoA-carboxylase] ligase [Clostridia bacterium]
MKGYILSKQTLEKSLEENKVKISLTFYNTTDSTNTRAKQLFLEKGKTGLCFAAEQSYGRGRQNRGFVSNKGGAYFSLAMGVNDESDFKQIFGSVLTMSLAVRSALEAHGVGAVVKWPNDVMVNGKKICGIMSEMVYCGTIPKCLIIGVGINVNTADFGTGDNGESISDIATSVFIEKGEKADIADITAKTIAEFFKRLFNPDYNLIEEYKLYCETLYNKVRVVKSSNNTVNGEAIRLTDEGFLIIKREDGEEEVIQYGDVSVRSFRQ